MNKNQAVIKSEPKKGHDNEDPVTTNNIDNFINKNELIEDSTNNNSEVIFEEQIDLTHNAIYANEVKLKLLKKKFQTSSIYTT